MKYRGKEIKRDSGYVTSPFKQEEAVFFTIKCHFHVHTCANTTTNVSVGV